MGTRNPQPASRTARRARAIGLAAALGTLAATALTGCIPSYPLAQGELDRYWMLTDVSAAFPASTQPATQPARPGPDKTEGFHFPTRWVIRQQDSLVWSTVSLVRAMDKLKAGTAEVDFSVSPAHARAAVNLLGQARAALADVREMVEEGARGNRNRWAETLAAALVRMESIARTVMAEEPPPGRKPQGEPLGMAAEPLLDLLAQYMDLRSGGGLLEELSPAERTRVRDVLVGALVKLGFEVAGKEATPDVRTGIADLMRSAGDTNALTKALGRRLTEKISQAPPARGGQDKRKAVLAVLRWAPKGIKFLESFLSQWDRIDRITVELVRGRGESAVAVTIATLPDREVRIDDVMTGLPALVFRGATRIVIRDDATPAGETVIAFDPVGRGAVELRYEGLIYGLVRLLALPLDSGPLREVRIASGSVGDRQLLNIALLSEAAGDRGDARRMIVVQDSRTRTILREAFSVQAVTDSGETVVSYITPRRRYTYQRTVKPAKP